MELNDALRRVFGQHKGLILWFIAFGVCAAALLHIGDTQTYTASTRFALDTEDPQTQSESISISDTAKAIATSPLQVRRAIVKARAPGRDPIEVAGNNVSIRTLGTSGVLQLSVSDPHPRAAAAIANALAKQVIDARLRVSTGQIKGVLADLGRQIDAVTGRIAALDAKIDELSGGQGLAAASGTSLTAARLRDLLRTRDSLTQQRTAYESERVRTLSTDAVRPAPSIISPATTPRSPDASRRVPDMILGGVLGLILGAGLAALIESLRPTLVGGEALARRLDTPLVGTLAGGDHVETLLHVTGALRLAARTWGVRSISLVAVRRDFDLTGLAALLDVDWIETPGRPAAVNGSAVEVEPSQTNGYGLDLRVQPFEVEHLAMSNGNGDGTGLVVVAPPAVKQSELDEVLNLLRMSPGPLVGVITYTPAPDPAGRHNWMPQLNG